MFNFTTTTIVNSNAGELEGGVRFKGYSDRKQFVVARMGTFDVDSIEEVDVANAVEPVKEEISIDMATLGEGHFGLKLYIGLSTGSNDSYYANNTWKKGRAFLLDFDSEDVKDLETWKKKLQKALIFTYGNGKHVDITVDGRKLTLSAVNEFQRFASVEIVKYDLSNANVSDTTVGYEVVQKYSPVASERKGSAITLKTAGKEGFGTYNYIVSNLRLPNSQHFGAFIVGKDEMPIEGHCYTQITIHYCKNRGNLGMNAVGQKVQSATTHVFFVDDSVSPSFVSELMNAGLTKDTLLVKANSTDSAKSNPIATEGDKDAVKLTKETVATKVKSEKVTN